MAGLELTTISKPNNIKRTIIGMSHQRLFDQKKPNNSPTTPKLEDMLRRNAFIVKILLINIYPVLLIISSNKGFVYKMIQ